MADIFLSYARADRERVAPLVAALESMNFSVWWDTEISPGEEFDDIISRALDAAKVVIAVWTPLSVNSRWVRGEARIGADRGVLVPVRFDSAVLPIDMHALHTIDLDDWDGDAQGAEFQLLLRTLQTKISGTASGPGPNNSPKSASGGEHRTLKWTKRPILRRVFRIAMVYLAATWVVLQVAEVLIGVGVLPESAGPASSIVLASVFPIVLLLTWFDAQGK